MKINIKATGIELTPAISAYAEKRFSKVTKYLGEEEFLMSVELGKNTEHHKQGDIFKAEVRISGGGTNFYATRESSDLYAAIDEVEDEIIREVTKDKGRRLKLLRRGQRAVKDIVRGFPWVKWRK